MCYVHSCIEYRWKNSLCWEYRKRALRFIVSGWFCAIFDCYIWLWPLALNLAPYRNRQLILNVIHMGNKVSSSLKTPGQQRLLGKYSTANLHHGSNLINLLRCMNTVWAFQKIQDGKNRKKLEYWNESYSNSFGRLKKMFWNPMKNNYSVELYCRWSRVLLNFPHILYVFF